MSPGRCAEATPSVSQSGLPQDFPAATDVRSEAHKCTLSATNGVIKSATAETTEEQRSHLLVSDQ